MGNKAIQNVVSQIEKCDSDPTTASSSSSATNDDRHLMSDSDEASSNTSSSSRSTSSNEQMNENENSNSSSSSSNSASRNLPHRDFDPETVNSERNFSRLSNAMINTTSLDIVASINSSSNFRSSSCSSSSSSSHSSSHSSSTSSLVSRSKLEPTTKRKSLFDNSKIDFLVNNEPQLFADEDSKNKKANNSSRNSETMSNSPSSESNDIPINSQQQQRHQIMTNTSDLFVNNLSSPSDLEVENRSKMGTFNTEHLIIIISNTYDLKFLN